MSVLNVLLITCVVVATVLAVSLWLLGFPPVQYDSPLPLEVMLSIVKIVLASIAGVGGVVALVMAYRRQQDGEAERERADTRLLVERFGKASELIGSDKAAVRLAGVHAMASLADDWVSNRQTCVDVLCAYFRMPYVPPTEFGQRESAARHLARQERQVRLAILKIIGIRLRKEAVDRWSDCTFDLSGSMIDDGDLTYIELTPRVSVNLRRACFVAGELDLTGAIFSGGTLDLSGSGSMGGILNLRRAASSIGDRPNGLILPENNGDFLKLPNAWAIGANGIPAN